MSSARLSSLADQGEPALEAVVRQARLGERRHVGKDRRSLRRRHPERAQLAGLDLPRDRRDPGESHLDLAAHQVGRHLRQALVGNVLDVDLGFAHEQHAGQVQHRAVPRRAVVQHPGLGLGQRDQLLHVLRRHGGMRDEDDRRIAQDADRRDVAQAVERDRLVDVRVDRVVVRDDAERVAVLRRAHQPVGGGDATRAGHVLDHQGAGRAPCRAGRSRYGSGCRRSSPRST